MQNFSMHFGIFMQFVYHQEWYCILGIVHVS